MLREPELRVAVPCGRCGAASCAAIWDMPVCGACHADWHSRESMTSGAVLAHLGIAGVIGERFPDVLREYRRRTQVWAHELRRGAA
ncbi:MAG: hypothetical protein JNJ54_35160 [Myxococcaceae bacterium]|nr:hypothetical protein [Myxococcaceae bacterium]